VKISLKTLKSIINEEVQKIFEGGRMVQWQIPTKEKLKVDKVLKKLRLKIGKHYDIGVGRAGTFILELDRKYKDKVLEVLMKLKVRQIKEL
jgi:hypothetical protein